MNEAKLRAAGLWEKTSASGNRYFVGRLGGVRILIFENRDRQSDSDPTHHLYFAEAPDRPRTSTAGERAPAPATAGLTAPISAGTAPAPVATARHRRHPPYRHARAAASPPADAAPGGIDPGLNDEIPF